MNFAIGSGGLGRLKKNLINLFCFTKPKYSIQTEIMIKYRKLFELYDLLDKMKKNIKSSADTSLSFL